MNDNLIEEYQHNGLTIKLWYDWDNGNDPTDWGNYKIVQFRDDDFSTYEDLDNYLTENGKLLPSVQAKMRAGKIFTLSYSRYSNSDGGFYRLDGGIPSGEVDSRDVNGWIEFDDGYIKDTTYAERRTYAEQDLLTYTEWANGEVYGWTVERPDGEQIDGCWGYIGGTADDLKQEAEAIADTIRSSSLAKNARELHR